MMLSGFPHPRLQRKFDFVLVPAKNASSTAALS